MGRGSLVASPIQQRYQIFSARHVLPVRSVDAMMTQSGQAMNALWRPATVSTGDSDAE